MLKNSKLKGYFVRLDTLDNEQTIKSEMIVANTRADAIIIFADKYYNLINKTIGNIHVVDKPIDL